MKSRLTGVAIAFGAVSIMAACVPQDKSLKSENFQSNVNSQINNNVGSGIKITQYSLGVLDRSQVLATEFSPVSFPSKACVSISVTSAFTCFEKDIRNSGGGGKVIAHNKYDIGNTSDYGDHIFEFQPVSNPGLACVAVVASHGVNAGDKGSVECFPKP